MIEQYLQFPAPSVDKDILFSGAVALDNKNRFSLPNRIIKALNISESTLFDLLNFSDKDIPYIQYVPQTLRVDSHRIFLHNTQQECFSLEYKQNGFAVREEYIVRAETICSDSTKRLIISPSKKEILGLQSATQIHMIFSYPSIKIYSIENYSRLLTSYANSKK